VGGHGWDQHKQVLVVVWMWGRNVSAEKVWAGLAEACRGAGLVGPPGDVGAGGAVREPERISEENETRRGGRRRCVLDLAASPRRRAQLDAG